MELHRIFDDPIFSELWILLNNNTLKRHPKDEETYGALTQDLNPSETLQRLSPLEKIMFFVGLGLQLGPGKNQNQRLSRP